jgi:hypothetical protein
LSPDDATAVDLFRHDPAPPTAAPTPSGTAAASAWRGRCGCWLVRLRWHRRAEVGGATPAGEPILVVGGVGLVLGTGWSLYRLVTCAVCGDEVASRARPLRRRSDLDRPAEPIICGPCCARAAGHQPSRLRP